MPSSIWHFIELVKLDMMNQYRIAEILGKFRPDEFDIFTAYSSGAKMFNFPAEITNLNGPTAIQILDATRKFSEPIGYYLIIKALAVGLVW